MSEFIAQKNGTNIIKLNPTGNHYGVLLPHLSLLYNPQCKEIFQAADIVLDYVEWLVCSNGS